jgi:predicted TIM-barrel fold metal-dependent hydrolase
MADGRLYYPDGRAYSDNRWMNAGVLGFEREEGAMPRYGDGRHGATDPKGRIEDLDLEGIDATMLYPTVGLAAAYEEDVLLAGAMARAYNTWLSDWCSDYPQRLYAVAMIPVQSVAVAVEELRFARSELGLKAAFLRPHDYKGRTIHSEEWYPFWAEAQDLDCPIAFHGGMPWPSPQTGADRFTADQAGAVHVVVHPFEQQLALVGLIHAGVFDRFPRLRVAFLESGGGWIVPVLERLERHYDQEQSPFSGRMSQNRPWDYFKENCWISFEPVEASLGLLADHIGPDKILWASDYPHPDGFFPGVLELLEGSMKGCTEDTKLGVLGRGARTFYNV